jgi:uroporphyrinogen-III decarboxylase
MHRDYYLDLARRGMRYAIGTDLVLNEEPDPEAVRKDGARLGKVVEKAARRQRTPVAIPLMDLRLEKLDLLSLLGLSEEAADSWKLTQPDETVLGALRTPRAEFPVNNQAHQKAIEYIDQKTDLLPVGMLIGPFSLMTKLMADPITAVAMAGNGVSAEEDAQVRLLESLMELSMATVLRSAAAQVEAGARALMVCEPAANVVYLSPRQLRKGSDIFERFVMKPNLRLREMLDEFAVDLIFHDCGELTQEMVQNFAERLHPVILSLGSSRKLWEDAAVVPKDVVLFGNLPTKSFYSDAAMPLEEVVARTQTLLNNMKACGHPHILGSECDVLYVADAAETIQRKVDAMLAVEVGR